MTFNKITVKRKDLESSIDKVTYIHKESRVTCTISIYGVEIKGHSSCSKAQKFNLDLGKRIAYENAIALLLSYEEYAESEIRKWKRKN